MENSNITLEQRLTFLQGLELPELPENMGEMPVSQSGSPSANVDAGQVIAFSPEVTQSEHSDVLNSCLLAQLAADKKFNRKNRPVEWYDFYSQVLSHCGWTLSGFHFEEYQSSSASFGVDTFMLNLLTGLATDSMISLVSSAVNFLRALKNTDPRSILFNHNSHSGKDGNFQLSACFQNKGTLTMGLGCSYFSASEETDDFFFLHFEQSDSEVFLSKQTIMLSMDVYNQVRSEVVKKLGDRAKSYIGELEI